MNLRGLVNKKVFICAGCRGFTLIEVLVALSIGSMIMVGATQVLQQILILVPRAEGSMLAMRQVQFAGHWIDRDAVMAQVIAQTENQTYDLSAQPLVMYHSNWDSDNITVTYSIDKTTDPANYKLNRLREVKYYATGMTTSNQMQVAESITKVTTNWSGTVLTVQVFSTVWSASENRTYKTSPRAF